MPTYKVTGRMVRISHGVLELSEDQASVRMHHLKRISKNKYEVTGAVEFKNGEEIGYPGELPKTLAIDLTSKSEADAEAKKAAALAKAEADKREKEEAEARKQAEAKARKDWDASENLRDSFDGDFAAYLVTLGQ